MDLPTRMKRTNCDNPPAQEDFGCAYKLACRPAHSDGPNLIPIIASPITGISVA